MILDTSIIIELLINNYSIQEKLEKIGERTATTSISKYELLKAPRDNGATTLIEHMNIYDFNATSSEIAARLYKELSKKGKLINEFDILIASVAISRDELLVTADHDFKNIDGLKVVVL